MTKRPLLALLVAALLTAPAGSAPARAQEGRKAAPAEASAPTPARVSERAPAAVIPAPRAEPVVPPSPAKSIAVQLNDAFVSVFERVAPAVVIIDVVKRPSSSSEAEGGDAFNDFFHQGPDGDSTAPEPPNARRQKPTSEGSGFLIQSGGYILTNNHVVAGANRISVKLKDGRQFPARLVGTDEKTDIAVVKIDAADLPVEELADSDGVRVGEITCAIGVPYNLDYTFTTGVVSAKGRHVLNPDGNDNYEDYLQTDASINPGNSGGPLVNLDGKVIGMNTLINGLDRGLGFAISSNLLREVGDQLIRSGRVIRPYIGVIIRSVGEDTPERFNGLFNGVKRGVVVETITADAPAWRSDLRPSDVITEVDGVPVGTARELQKQILARKVGSTVQLSVLRRGKSLKVAVTTSELPAEVAKNAAGGLPPGPDGEAKRREAGQFFGLQWQDLTREQAASLGVSAAGGIVVTSVAEDSPAARARPPISVNDVITAVDDRPVKDTTSFKEALKAGDPKRGVACSLERASGKSFAVIKTE